MSFTLFKPFLLASFASVLAVQHVGARENDPPPVVHHRYAEVNGVKVFYREAGPRNAPAVLLLHGFGASSHMFRELMPKLAAKYHVVAPDLPGFGLTTVAKEKPYEYSFHNLAKTIEAFTEVKGLDQYAVYVFDYGAPVAWRLAVWNPQKITAIVSQNGNAYEEGLSDGWAEIRKAWREPSAANRENLRKLNTLEMVKWQYTQGVKDESLIAPESYLLAQNATDRLGQEIQLDLIIDYAQNIKQYPQVQEFFRQYRRPTLAIWGKNDPFFLPAGAEAFKKDNPKAEIHFLDTGHFALETHGGEIASRMLSFLDRNLPKGR
jgi:pimeloyl-ACP methyl ester carboxylesterase